MAKNALLMLLLMQFSCSVFAVEKVVLQLKWEHEFQFAGYYAAQWQGFYRAAGLDVEIRPASREGGGLVQPVDEIKNGNAQFAVGALDILIGEDSGLDLVILAPIFQRSPSAIFSLGATPLEDLSQLAKLRIAAVEDDATKMEIDALFRARGYDLGKINYVNVPVSVESLLNNKADAIVTYEISAKTQARERGVTLSQLNLADFGMEFYGDTLYTSLDMMQRKPDLVKKFVAATKKGWIYALKNKLEIAKRISKELPRHIVQYQDITDYNVKFSEFIDTLILYPQKDIGDINKGRWFSMNERMRSLGIVRSHLDNEKFFFDAGYGDDDLSLNVGFYLLFLFLLLLVFIFWYKKNVALTLLSVVLLSLLVELQTEALLDKEKEQSDKIDLLQQLTSVSARLEGNLQTNLSMLTGFAAYISAEPSLTYDDFNHYAKELFKKEPMLINFAAAKDLIVNYVYPSKGNEKAIGLNYRKNELQRPMVMQTVNTGQLQVVGPVNLVQGGVAFIGRAPIFTGDGENRELWGIISAPLDAELLYLHSDIREVSGTMRLAIRRYDSLGEPGPVFFGDESVFSDPESIKIIIGVGGGTWHLAATNNEASQGISINILVVRIISILTTLMFCVLILFRFGQVSKTQMLEATIFDNQELLENVGSVAKIGGWKIDANFRLIQWSKQSSLLLGDQQGFRPITLMDVSDRFSVKDFLLWKGSISRAFEDEISFDIELEVNVSAEKSIWVRLKGRPTVDESGAGTVTGTMQDVTDKVLSARLIERQATYDSLTDLPNRTLFNDRLSNSIEYAQRNGNCIAVLFIDLDRFKPVNDNHGHQVGDKLLVEAARRIRGCVRESDTVSRLSGDEFGVIISDIPDQDGALPIVEHILDVMQSAFNLSEVSVHCSASIGVAVYPNDAVDADSLIRKADQAMYEVKGSGRNGWHFYTKEMQEKSEYRHALLNQLIVAIAGNKLKSYYQPIVDLTDGKVVKCESLARWIKEDGQFVPPVEFIGLAEESGLVNKIDLYMLENSANEMGLVNVDGRNIELSINVSPRLFHTKDRALEKWLERIEAISQQLDVTVEITERLLTDGSDKALVVLKKLKKFGVKIAIDDFGTGYSSLSYLIKFPVDIIKIDRAFISEIGQESSAETLIETVLLMARRLGIQVVAEGIETQEQLDFLKKHQCEFGQGYYLGRPASLDVFQGLVSESVSS